MNAPIPVTYTGLSDLLDPLFEIGLIITG